jgi:uncharacterized membrane protein
VRKQSKVRALVSAAAALAVLSVALPLAAHGPITRPAGAPPPAPRVPAYRVLDVGTLQEGVSSLFRGLNNAGHGAGGSGTFGSGHRALMLSSSRVEPIGPPGADYSRAFGLNDLGEVVGSVNTASAVRGFVWSRAGGLRLLSPLPGDSGSEGFAINGRSETVGVSSGPRGTHAVRWSPSGVPQALATVAGTRTSRALAINDAGDAAGSAEDGRTRRAVRWRGGAGADELGALPGHVASEAVAINQRADIAGWSGPLGAERAVLWVPGLAVRDLGTLPGGEWSRARAVNGRGEVVGTSGSFLGARAFRWTAAAGLQDLNDLIPISDFVLVDVSGINDAGDIFVIGRDEVRDAGVDTHTNHEFPVRVFFLQPLP